VIIESSMLRDVRVKSESRTSGLFASSAATWRGISFMLMPGNATTETSPRSSSLKACDLTELERYAEGNGRLQSGGHDSA
jgi:hypothetical protein